MNKNNTAITVTTILCTLFFIVVGSCFSVFLYADEIVKIQNPKIYVTGDIKVFDEKGEKEIDVLKFSEMKLGLKPATGDEDATTKIPTTVHDKQGTEGVFAKFKILAPSGAKVVVSNIKFDGKISEEIVEKERENIMISMSNSKKEAKSLKDENVHVFDVSPSSEKTELTLLVWLSSSISNDFNSETISFDLRFEVPA